MANVVEQPVLRSMLKRLAITVMLLGVVLRCAFAFAFKTDRYVDAYATENTAISGATIYTLTRRKRFRFFLGPDLVESPISAAQFDNLRSTHMKLSGVKTGLLINFNVIKLKDGIKRIVLWSVSSCSSRPSWFNLYPDRPVACRMWNHAIHTKFASFVHR